MRAGVKFEELKRRHDELLNRKKENKTWGPQGRTATYAGAGVGLVKDVKTAGCYCGGGQGDYLGFGMYLMIPSR